MKDYTVISDDFQQGFSHLQKSWQWIRTDFTDELQELRENNKLTENDSAKIIWNTKTKFTIICSSGSGRKIVYKQYRKIKRKLHYMLRLSPLAHEAVNYCMLKKLGFPMAELLAVGDSRKNFILNSGFLITEFAEGSQNGAVFAPGNQLAEEHALRMKFCQVHIKLLAKLHDNGILHLGCAPANLLWRLKDDTIDPIWIDVASCRKKCSFILKKRIPEDLGNLFSGLALQKNEILELVNLYLDSTQIKRFASTDALLKKIQPVYQKKLKQRFPDLPAAF